MSESKQILIVENDEDLAATLKEQFEERARVYSFEAEKVSNPQEYLDKGLGQRHFDVYIVDLDLTGGGNRFSGLRIIGARSRKMPGSLIFVYSQYPETENVVKSIRLGATDFIEKVRHPAHELVAIVEKRLEDERKAYERRLELDKLASEKAEEWHRDYQGKTLAIVGDTIAVVADSRLEALIRYDQERPDHPEWPEEPDLLDVY